MQRRSLRFFALSIFLLVICVNSLVGQAIQRKSPFSAYARDRVIRPIDDQRRIVLPNNRHPLAQPEFRIKPVPQDFRMDRMVLVLNPDADQQAALDDLVAQQHDPNSPYYHQWITPERYAELFGASENDVALITNWLLSHGMSVDEITPGRRSIVFSGSSEQVNSAFHTRIQTYKVNDELHHANENDPEIPLALAGVVGGSFLCMTSAFSRCT
jgi:hypothetical protein